MDKVFCLIFCINSDKMKREGYEKRGISMPPLKIRYIRARNLVKACIRFVRIVLKEKRWPDWQLVKVSDRDFYLEKRLYLALTSAGYRVKTHILFGDLEVDLYIPKYKLAIEADGKAYHSSPAQKERDRKKEYVLKKHYKLKVKRFNSNQINKKLDWCVEKVHEITGGPRLSFWQHMRRIWKVRF
ncbi:endonuclease domain-containing protein [Laceyella putida]|uniref:Endonuclease domain-containing protein n=1 Tax=Laceyella putida TaxID=110101 RepID=A0ABW2RR84_9BACL